MINSELNEYIYNFIAGYDAALVCYCFQTGGKQAVGVY